MHNACKINISEFSLKFYEFISAHDNKTYILLNTYIDLGQ